MPCRQPRLATVLLGKLKEDQLPSDALKLLRNMRLVRMEPRTQPCVEIVMRGCQVQHLLPQQQTVS